MHLSLTLIIGNRACGAGAVEGVKGVATFPSVVILVTKQQVSDGCVGENCIEGIDLSTP